MLFNILLSRTKLLKIIDKVRQPGLQFYKTLKICLSETQKIDEKIYAFVTQIKRFY